MRTFILDVDRRIEELWKASHPDGYWEKDLPIAGRCYEGSGRALVKASLIVPKVQAMITGKALPCYIATNLGCIVDGWLADPGLNLAVGPPTLPFTKSKVTIVEQTPDRVVADVTEAAYEDVTDGVAGFLKNEKFHPYSDAQAAEITDKSRYTITRGADGIWRISDLKQQPEKTPWECRLN